MKMPVDADSIVCEDAINRLSTISKSLCRRDKFDPVTGTGSYKIEFLEYPLFSAENNLNFHDGNPHLSLFYCNNTGMDDESAVSPYCDVEDVAVSNIPGKSIILLKISESFSLFIMIVSLSGPFFSFQLIFNAVTMAHVILLLDLALVKLDSVVLLVMIFPIRKTKQ